MNDGIDSSELRLLIEISEITSLLETSQDMIDKWSPESPSFYRWLTQSRGVFERYFEAGSDQLRKAVQLTTVPRDDSRWGGSRVLMDEAKLGARVGEIERILSRIRVEMFPFEDPSTSSSGHELDPLVRPLRIFVAHDGATAARAKLEDFIRSLGAEPVITEREPSKGRSVATKVADTIRSCDFAVAIATTERASSQDGMSTPRGNITEEIPRLQNQFGDKWMMLVEEGLTMPSNQAEFVRETFRTDNMETALVGIIRELRAHRLIIVGVAE